MLTFNISHQFKNTHFRVRIFWAKNIQNKAIQKPCNVLNISLLLLIRGAFYNGLKRL